MWNQRQLETKRTQAQLSFQAKISMLNNIHILGVYRIPVGYMYSNSI